MISPGDLGCVRPDMRAGRWSYQIPATSFTAKTWMPGASSAKTRFALLPGHDGF